MISRIALWLGLVHAAAGCAHDRTEIVVATDSDLAIPTELGEIRFDVTGPRGQTQQASITLDGVSALPVSVGLVHEDGPLGPLTVSATGALGDTLVVERRARLAFVSERTLLLRLDLERACMTTACGPDETCHAGVCRSIDVDPAELEPWTGLPPHADIDAGSDAGRLCGGEPCALLHASGGCRSDVCVLDACDPDWYDCDGSPSNGCESDLRSTTDCGACGVPCARPHAIMTCMTGICEFGACEADWGDCDEMLTSGCEADFMNSPDACGRCAHYCRPVETCVDGNCVPAP